MEHNKLVRDRIPEIIESKGDSCKIRVLNDEEFVAALNAKLNEEVAEYQESHSMEELADILEVVMAIAMASGHDWQEVLYMRQKKAEERGGFYKKIFLEETQSKAERWIYETGRDETNVLDSGTSLFNVFKSYDAEKVFARHKADKGNNYLCRYHKVDGCVVDVQYWNPNTEKWMD